MKTTFRKISPALAVLGIAALSLTACGGDKEEASPKSSESSSSAAAESTEATDESTEATDESTEATDESTDAAAGSESAGTEASGGDAAACKAVFETLQNSTSELSSVGTDPEKAASTIGKIATDVRSQADKISDADAKAAGTTIADFFQDIADAAKSNDTSKISELSSEISSSDSDYMKAAQTLGTCMTGQ
jgi:hypothetical protein